MRHAVLVPIVLVALAAVASAQVASSVALIPVVAKTAGAAGTDWRSDVSVSNLSPFAVEVVAGFFREARNNALSFDFPTVATLQAGQTVTAGDVLGTWFPAEGNTKGALLIMAEPAGAGEPEQVRLAVSSRTYNNADPNATYGQSVDPSFMGMVYGRGLSVLTGVRHDQRFRSNVGVLNLSPAPVQVLVTTYNGSGAQVAQVAKTVESLSLRQWALDGLGVPTLADGRTEVEIDPATITWDPCDQGSWTGFNAGFFLAYLSKVDQATGDGEFHLGQVDWSQFEADCGQAPDDCP